MVNGRVMNTSATNNAAVLGGVIVISDGTLSMSRILIMLNINTCTHAHGGKKRSHLHRIMGCSNYEGHCHS